MSKRRKKKSQPAIHLSAGPLPLRLAELYPNHVLVFSDASQLAHGGLAAILFRNAGQAALALTRSVPPCGSNMLELLAALFALEQTQVHFPDRALALFSDNHDAVTRLLRAKVDGLAQDPALAAMPEAAGLSAWLERAEIRWIKGHGSCRGNALADWHARIAAGGAAEAPLS